MPLLDRARFTFLSASRQGLIRLCQLANYGYIEDLVIENGEPILDPAPAVFVDLKLDSEECSRREFNSPDFLLCAEIKRLMALFDEINNGIISKLEVRAGIPRRVIFEHRISELQGGRRE